MEYPLRIVSVLSNNDVIVLWSNNKKTKTKLIIPKNILIRIKLITPHKLYLLYSNNNKAKRKTYVGYTIDVNRRLRQHNGEITGGAKRTKKGRPWDMVCYIEGFPDHRTALQCEWVVNKNRSHSLINRIDQLINSLKIKWSDHGSLDRFLFTINWLKNVESFKDCNNIRNNYVSVVHY